MKRLILLLALIILLIGTAVSSGVFGINWSKVNEELQEKTQAPLNINRGDGNVRVISEESIVIEVVEKLTPSVVTIGVERTSSSLRYDPFDPFSLFENPRQEGSETLHQDIGSGFIVSSDGLIVTNKHVVSEPNVRYQVITSDNKSFEIENIYRDPANDIAIVKINASGLSPVEMGDSESVKVGQLVVAMGTPLGEFRGSVTRGIVSGLGRGITAGSPFEGFAEEIDDVIQTDAAINPGNSGGPLVNSAAQVIGINTAVASGAENIGFALPINLVRKALQNFEETGSFDRAFLGISYQMLTRDQAIMYEVPDGAYIREVVDGSAADEAGIEPGDIITHFDGRKLQGEDSLAELINQKKIGDRVALKIWRDGQERDLSVTMGKYDQ